MNKSIVWGLLCLALTFMHTGYAQLTKEECDQRAEAILAFKNDFKDYPPALIDELIAYIDPCANRFSPASLYVKGLLHLKREQYSSALSAMKLSAFYQHGPAQLQHGINHLLGNYKNQERDYGLALRYLADAANNNHKPDLANYIRGYINMKGFNSTLQFQENNGYSQAKDYFEQSTHPMAKHWLAVMYYFGYGVPKDEQKALLMLSENDIFNSHSLLEHLPTQNNEWIPISAEELLACKNALGYYSATPGKVNKTFTGKFIEFDWYGTGVKRLLPVTITLDTDIASGDRPFRYDFTINGNTISGTGTVKRPNTFLFDNLSFSLPRFHKDHPDKNNVTYTINQIQVAQKSVDGISSLVGHVTGDNSAEIIEFEELMKAPIRFILHEQGTTAAIAARSALVTNNQHSKTSPLVIDKNFATIAPNPIGDQFTITYTLNQSAEVNASVYDFYGQQRIQAPSQRNTSNGTQTITIDSSALPSGTYVIQMTIDGQPFSKTVIKE
ncbi:T9SS type A sorting domain-containing protein [Aquimarina algiphila]|uniref:T9SS type A sorting domain-containing protein n=1 Tax=Aquimarina algiphila TaxID=2047982 RepID=A0A554VKC0_9FLAO|nr:T9SS type A sorting domain-containing protein [Aquimarina algiphila]TSE08414.1 T9SS type A sorting domain-containing protein [Aquimarina algiphila]